MTGRRGFGTPPPERIDPLEEPSGIVAHHLVRYELADRLLYGGVIADIGCGLGYGTATLAREDRSVLGCDTDQPSVATATSRYSSSGVTFAVMDAQRLAISDSSLDGVVCFEALEHLSDPESHASEAARVLKADGIYLVSTPRAGTGGSPEINPHHLHEFDRDSLTELLGRFFDHVSILGQTRNRAGLHGLAVRLDVLGVRKLRFAQPVLRKLAAVLGGRATEDAAPEDFSIGPQTVGSSELIAVCRGPSVGR